ncbi:MAG: efflux RND transporter permease subunit, partial [Bdellovibrionales bacterium]|nr:efflux RND transporter permease subunit [Bdellovibrionales bacterium]
SILIGVLLTIIVGFFFLGSARSTLITGLALPNSLIGAFILMAYFGFTINVMTLLALSLAVGLLVDDAIVVRENIFRHLEMGKTPRQAALEGTQEVSLAVIATTLTVLAVFGPVAFLKGVVGQFFREFGLTICFAMAISLFDALTIAPMMSTYFGGSMHSTNSGPWLYRVTLGRMVNGFNTFQVWLENIYESLLKVVVRRPALSLFVTMLIFLSSFVALKFVPKTFLPTQEAGEFTLSIELPSGTTLNQMEAEAKKVDQLVRAHSEVSVVSYTIGSGDGDANRSDFYVLLVPSKERKGVSTSSFKEMLREELKPFAYANPQVKDFDAVGGGQRPFTLNIVGFDQEKLEKYAKHALEIVKANPGLKDVDWNYRTGKPEFQAILIPEKADLLGVSTISMGSELRAQIEGVEAAKYRENGREYNIRVRLQEDQRDLRKSFAQTYVPNINMQLVRLADVATPFETTGPAKISRQDRARYIQIAADIAPGGGLGDIVSQLTQSFDADLKLPSDMRYAFVGQAENFAELAEGMIIAVGLGILFIFLVLASLYESFVTPITIMIALPLAVCGSFFALAMAKESLNIFSMIGMIMLLGIATKNSILLVDYASQLCREGMSRTDAIVKAGKTRLRPILMTTMALIAGMLPVALGLNEASKQRTSMGIAIIGGLISSTMLTLIVVPAVYQYFDRYREWSLAKMKRLFSVPDDLDGKDSKGHDLKKEGPSVSH